MSTKRATLFACSTTFYVLSVVMFLHVFDMLANPPLEIIAHWWGIIPIAFLAAGTTTFWYALREKK